MAAKFADSVDAKAMNSLYAGELTRLGVKTAQSSVPDKESVPGDPEQAFTDHKDYMTTLESIMREDKKVEGENANDPLLD